MINQKRKSSPLKFLHQQNAASPVLKSSNYRSFIGIHACATAFLKIVRNVIRNGWLRIGVIEPETRTDIKSPACKHLMHASEDDLNTD
jgi:hypothetical protein